MVSDTTRKIILHRDKKQNTSFIAVEHQKLLWLWIFIETQDARRKIKEKCCCHTLFLHGDVIKYVDLLHRGAVECDGDKLRIFRQCAHIARIVFHVGLVQRRVYLVHNAKPRWTRLDDGKIQAVCDEVLFSTREQRNRCHRFAGWVLL